MQWREPPDRVDRLKGDSVDFGRGRSRGSGYLAHSDRVGPGVLLLEANGHARADALNAGGFTVLLPEGQPVLEEVAVLEAAAEYLSANWHPRMGVVAIGTAGVAAASLLLERDPAVDVLVLYEDVFAPHSRPSVPVIGHYSTDAYVTRVEQAFRALMDDGVEVEVYVYEDERSDASALAHTRTLDALEYHLS